MSSGKVGATWYKSFPPPTSEIFFDRAAPRVRLRHSPLTNFTLPCMLPYDEWSNIKNDKGNRVVTGDG